MNEQQIKEPVARDGWRSLEPYLGKDVANKEVVLLDDVKALLAASPTQPRPQPLTTEQIDAIFNEHHNPQDEPWTNWRRFARAIESMGITTQGTK
jgi:hypothetical protein